jgi:hypothetical protein
MKNSLILPPPPGPLFDDPSADLEAFELQTVVRGVAGAFRWAVAIALASAVAIAYLISAL